jgi:uncharacterized protein (DUF305 family)
MAASSSASATAGSLASSSAEGSASHNDADTDFATGMKAHHEQAVDMAGLAADRAADPRVKDLAARIEAAQQPEIDTLTGWLADWGATGSASPSDEGMGGMDHSGHDTGGMMSAEDLTALQAATGAEFDRQFLALMLEHHRGAVAAAESELTAGENAQALALAESIRDTQNAEIAEMPQLLTELGG